MPLRVHRVESSGSAPRARGTQAQHAALGSVLRISPACAGNTVRHWHRCVCTADQPRVRGEHIAQTRRAVRLFGSAPRARGTPKRPPLLRAVSACADQPRVRGEHTPLKAGIRVLFNRISPACAGNTSISTRWLKRELRLRISPACAGNTAQDARREDARPSDQPRVRGEHTPDRAAHPDPVNGSAPRARGTPRRAPACALARGTDQPRVRGEHVVDATVIMSRRSLPDQPRVRGEHLLPAVEIMLRVLQRISPACAGNTRTAPIDCRWRSNFGSAPRARGTLASACSAMLPVSTDQPRVRGEHIEFNAARSPKLLTDQPRVRGEHSSVRIGEVLRMMAGSAPRARGTPQSSAYRAPLPATDQPRVRGEHTGETFEVGRDRYVDGSAPRARGTRRQPVRGGDHPRISPACAGNTQ